MALLPGYRAALGKLDSESNYDAFGVATQFKLPNLCHKFPQYQLIFIWAFVSTLDYTFPIHHDV
jgi:hypothetical protein